MVCLGRAVIKVLRNKCTVLSRSFAVFVCISTAEVILNPNIMDVTPPNITGGLRKPRIWLSG